MTKTKKTNLLKVKVWVVFDKDLKVVGAHHGKKYIADMNAMFVEDGIVIPGIITVTLPKNKTKRIKRK